MNVFSLKYIGTKSNCRTECLRDNVFLPFKYLTLPTYNPLGNTDALYCHLHAVSLTDYGSLLRVVIAFSIIYLFKPGTSVFNLL